MKQTEQTLLEQMRITEFDVANRMALLSFSEKDISLLKSFKPTIQSKLDSLVDRFYQLQTAIPEIALLIGDSDTLDRLSSAQHRYILDLFCGFYDLNYVNNRLRIGLVHKRIGVEPKLYLSAINTLKELIIEVIYEETSNEIDCKKMVSALDKLLLFDITLVFETYIRSLVAEIETSKTKSERYALELEQRVRDRTQQLEEMTRVDSLTGLLNVRYLIETLTGIVRAAQRRAEPVSIVYIDVDDFKVVNDTQGHQRGDEILRAVGSSIRKISRNEDRCFRYGGDEFCLVLPNCTEEQARDVYVNRLNNEIRKSFKKVNLSVGIVQAGPVEYEEPEVLVSLADEQMYAVKRAIKESAKN